MPPKTKIVPSAKILQPRKPASRPKPKTAAPISPVIPAAQPKPEPSESRRIPANDSDSAVGWGVGVLILLVAIGALIYSQSRPATDLRPLDNPPTGNVTTGQDGKPATYRNDVWGISFSFPAKLAYRNENGVVVLSHSVPFRNHGSCDMNPTQDEQENLDDFLLRIRVLRKSVADSVREISPYMGAEYFKGDTLAEMPGFIDRYKIGDLDGFVIYEGAEGCGQMTYYFPLPNNRTMMLQKDLVQIFSGIRNTDEMDRLLEVPNVITPLVSEKIFADILRSIKVENK